MDIFSPRSSERANEIKEQVAAELRLDEHATVMVSEVEEGCPRLRSKMAASPSSAALRELPDKMEDENALSIAWKDR